MLKIHRVLTAILVLVLLWFVYACGSLKRSSEVSMGAGAGAGIGLLAGPAGAVAGGAIGAGVTSAYVEADSLTETVGEIHDQVRDINNRLSKLGAPPPDHDRPKPQPPPWWRLTPFQWLRIKMGGAQ